MSLITTSGLELQIGKLLVCRNLNFSVEAGERCCLLGKNGVGKTTLLHSLLGLHPVSAGTIMLGENELHSLQRREVALKMGILFQEGLDSLPATVMETVMLGRHPHAQSLLFDRDEGIDYARKCMQIMGLEALADRQIAELSGGERQRLALAKLLAQQPKIYLLDEPSNHLDIGFQLRLQKVLEERMAEDGSGLIMATHDINLAARFCNRFLLLTGDGELQYGSRDEVLTTEKLSAAFDCDIRTVSDAGRTFYYPGSN